MSASVRDSRAQRLLGWIAFNGIFLVVIGTNLLLFYCLWRYPTKVSLYLLLPYYTYIFFLARHEFTGAARWKFFSENFLFFAVMRRYLQLEFRVSPALAASSSETQFLFALFPHGVASDFRILMDGMLHSVLPLHTRDRIRVLAASVLFTIPIARELALWTGCVDARRSVAENMFSKRGFSVLVLPGGEAEQLRTEYGKEEVHLKHRKGFVKLAMRQGVPIVPVYAFGVSDYYYTSNAFFGLRNWLVKKLGVCIPLAVGAGGSIFCPLPVKTTIVFGDPISFPMKNNGNPTDDELNAAHQGFCVALTKLFEEHKQELGYHDRDLVIR